MPGCRVGMLRVSQGMLKPLVLAARKAARGDGTCLWEMQEWQKMLRRLTKSRQLSEKKIF